MTLAPISTDAAFANPPTREARPNTASPRKKTFLLPKVSASLPHVTISTPNESAYPLTTHCMVSTVVVKSFSIAGRATFMDAMSTAIAPTPIPIAMNVSICCLVTKNPLPAPV